MAKRRVIDKPDRGRGWSNGRYTKAKDRNRDDGSNYYYAYCQECEEDCAHEWDECVQCKERNVLQPKQK